MPNKDELKLLKEQRDFVEKRIREQNSEFKGQGGSPKQTKRLEKINHQINLKLKNQKSKSKSKLPMKHKGPYMMKPGSKEINTPGTFRADSKAMMFKPKMYKK